MLRSPSLSSTPHRKTTAARGFTRSASCSPLFPRLFRSLPPAEAPSHPPPASAQLTRPHPDTVSHAPPPPFPPPTCPGLPCGRPWVRAVESGTGRRRRHPHSHDHPCRRRHHPYSHDRHPESGAADIFTTVAATGTGMQTPWQQRGLFATPLALWTYCRGRQPHPWGSWLRGLRSTPPARLAAPRDDLPTSRHFVPS